MGGVVDAARCGDMLQHDGVGAGGDEVAGGESGADNIGGDESVSGREQCTDTEGFGRRKDVDCGDGANGQKEMVAEGQEFLSYQQGGRPYCRRIY